MSVIIVINLFDNSQLIITMLSISLNSVLIRKYQDFIIMIIHEPNSTVWQHLMVHQRGVYTMDCSRRSGRSRKEGVRQLNFNWTIANAGPFECPPFIGWRVNWSFFNFHFILFELAKKSKWPFKIKFWHLKRRKLFKLEKQKSSKSEQR